MTRETLIGIAVAFGAILAGTGIAFGLLVVATVRQQRRERHDEQAGQ